MGKNKNNTTYANISPRRLQSARIAICGGLLAVLLVLAVFEYMMLPTSGVNEVTYLFACTGALILLCICFLIYLIYRQEKINTLFSSLIVVFEYNSRYLYRFNRQQAARRLPLASLITLGISIILWIVAWAAAAAPDGASSLVFLPGAVMLLLAVLFLPIVRCRLNYLVCLMLGKDRHIVLSRRGVLTSSRLLNFGFNSTTFFKAEKRHVGSFDCITMYYHKRRGYSLEPSTFDIPLPFDTTDAEIEELLSIYNSGDLFMHDRPSYML